MMTVYEAIAARRTVRDFEDRKIEPDLLHRIIAAGLQAPTNDHMREWEFVIIDDMTARLNVIGKVNFNYTAEDAKGIVDNWGLIDENQRAMYINAIPKQYRMLANAGSLIVPLFRQDEPLLSPKNLSALNPFASIWLCIGNMLLAAASEGIFGVTRIPFDEEITHIRAALDIPSNYEIPCYLALGYPAKDAPINVKQAVEVEQRIHLNRW